MKDFAELKGLRDQLKENERVRAIEQAEREQRERLARERAVEFRSSMQGVRKLPESDRYVHRPVYVAPNRPIQRGPVLSA
ncbi:MAG: DNA mismatch repair protein MutS, partial [Massilia sp.]